MHDKDLEIVLRFLLVDIIWGFHEFLLYFDGYLLSLLLHFLLQLVFEHHRFNNRKAHGVFLCYSASFFHNCLITFCPITFMTLVKVRFREC